MTPDRPTIRTARPDDVAAIGEAHAAAWQTAYVDIFSPADLARLVEERRTVRWPATLASPAFPATSLLVAEQADHVLGFIHFGPSRTHPPTPPRSTRSTSIPWPGGPASLRR